ncbi:MAG: putative nucleotidyltransferase [Gemmatimonadetes bacterium]|nr:putative nucleotidyltransferase [Gemmatimonadota bacterium]
MSRPSAHALAVDALRLRGWAFDALSSAGAPAPPPPASAAAWGFFNEMEWCALPLRARLRDACVWDSCDAAARDALTAAALGEMRRVHSAREEMAAVAARALDRGWKVVVLKGGASVAAGIDVHLADVDLLMCGQDAAAMQDALAAEGLRGSPGVGEYGFAARRPDGVAIEVHESVAALGATDDALRDAVPLAGFPGLWKLSGERQLWHVLHHGVARHRDRAGRLREIVVLRHALGAASEAEIAGVEARARMAAEAEDLSCVLRMARASQSSDRIERYVRQRYFLLARWRWLGAARVATAALRQTLSISSLLAVPGRPALLRGYLLASTDAPSVLAAGRWLAARHRAAARALRIAARLPVLAAAAALAAGAAAEDRLSRRADEKAPIA